MFDAFFQGAAMAVQWPAFGYLLIGVTLGIWLGAVPGLGGALGIVLVLPFTYGMDSVSAFSLLLGIYTVTATSDTIASVMLGIPGTASSQATILDGYPMAKKGQAARAFGAAFTVSAFGGVFGAVILAVSLPIALPIILSFNNPELFMLGLLGLVMVGSLSGKSLTKGLAAAALGLVMSTVGYADDAAIPRYWMESTYLLEKLPLIPVVLGIFALPELMDLAVRDSSIAKVPKDQGGFTQMRQGIRDAFRHWFLALRCSVIGVYIGMIPGLGGAIVDWVAYGHAVQSTKNPETYGTGDIRGVIAPEAANNAVRGGALIPTVAFGVPGSAINALLLSALLIQGLQPGREMLTTQLPFTFSMVWTIALANIIAAGFLMVWSNQVAKISFISGHLIVPGVMLFVFMGAWLTTASPGDWITLMVFGILGWLMKTGGWPRPPIVLAFILGGLMENSFLISWRIHLGLGWITRPIVLGILVIVVLTLVFSIRASLKPKKAPPVASKEAGDTPAASDDLGLSLLTGGLLLVVFVAALIPTVGWPTTVAAFPLIGIVPGVLLTVFALLHDTNIARKLYPSAMLGALTRKTLGDDTIRRAGLFLGYCLGLMVVSWLIGIKLGLPIFAIIYLIRWGQVRRRFALLYGFVIWVILIGFYDRIVHIFWFKPALNSVIQVVIPDTVPIWLFL